MKRECETCIKKKTLYCPNSIECMATDDMPYYQNRIMILEENEKLKKELKERPKEYIFIGNAQNKTRDFINNITKENTKLLNQQKEFEKYLEKEINLYKNDIQNFSKDYKIYYLLINDLQTSKETIEEILLKYKEIIGGIEDEK